MWKKRALKWLSCTALGTGVALVLSIAALMTGPGQRTALKIAAWTASSPESAVTFGALEGGLFSDGRLDRIALADREGQWLEIRNVAFSWKPLALLWGRLHIDSLTVGAVDVARAPSPSGPKSSESTSSGIPLIKLVLARFEVARIDIAESVLGEPLQLDARADAHLVDPAAGLSANIAVHRLDGPGGHATARLSYRPSDETLDLEVRATAPGDGIVARLMDLGGASLDVAVDGSGPLSEWRASWSLAASGTPFAAGNASVDEDEKGHSIAAAFEGFLTPLAPQSAAALLAGKTTGTFQGRWAEGRLDVEQAALSNDALDVRASGGIDTASHAEFGDLVARIGRADASPLAFEQTGGEPLFITSADVKISAPKSATARNIAAEVTAVGIAQGGRSLNRVILQARASQPATTDLAFEDIDIRLDATGVRQSETDAPRDFAFDITGSAAPNDLDLTVTADGLTGTVRGDPSLSGLALTVTTRLADLTRFVPQATGAATLEARIGGTLDDLGIAASVSGEGMTLHGNAIAEPVANITSRKTGESFTAALDASASIAGEALTAKAGIESAAGGIAIQGLAVTLGQIHLTGELTMGESGFPSGHLAIDAPTLAALGAVVGQPVDGALAATVELADQPGKPALAFEARSPALRVGEARLDTLRAEGRFDELLAGIYGKADLTIASVSGSVDAKDIRLTANGLGKTVDLALKGIAQGAAVDVAATLAETDTGHDITLTKANLRQGAAAASLAQPGRIKVAGNAAHIETLAFAVGSGRIDLTGAAGAEKLGLAVRISRLPASIADSFAPEANLGLAGTIDGEIDIAGAPSAPEVNAKATWHNASAEATRGALPPVAVAAETKLRDRRLNGEIRIAGPHQLATTARGTLDLSPKGKLEATLSGDIPLALANASLAGRATRLSGRANLSGTVTGTLAAPAVLATVDVDGATVRDPESGLSLRPVVARARVTEKDVIIERLEATSERGGTLSGSGEIVLGQNGAPPTLRLELDLAQLRFDDRSLMKGELDGRFELSGTPGDLATSGVINLTRLDITVPSALPRSISTLDIRHVNAPEHIAAVEQKRASAEGAGAASGGDRIALDIRIDAANRIFVQGRGLDVQLGGSLRVGGSAATPVANGAFTMERGRLSILGRELDFRRGTIRFYGTLEPLLDMEAATSAGNVTIVVTVSGSSANPKFAFSSVPALPEDEIVALLLYNKDLAGLSPLQLAQLASEIDKIGGLSSGPGMLDKLKSSVGIDVLDVGTDSQGDATVSAGSYVSESTFVGVKQGTAAGSSQVMIDHELTKNLKAKGEVGADGKSKIGIGFEWDY